MASRRDELLDLAAEVLEAEGLEQFGIGPLARAAAIKPPSLYKHFDGLPDLIAELTERGFREFAEAVAAQSPAGPRHERFAAFAGAYRAQALRRPQLYRLMTERPLPDRARGGPGELAAMAGLLDLYDERVGAHTRSRVAWAAAHGLVQLEIAGRFPRDADLDDAWATLVDLLSR